MPYLNQFCSIQQAGFRRSTSYRLMLLIGNLSGVNFYGYFTGLGIILRKALIFLKADK